MHVLILNMYTRSTLTIYRNTTIIKNTCVVVFNGMTFDPPHVRSMFKAWSKQYFKLLYMYPLWGRKLVATSVVLSAALEKSK